MNNQQHHHHSNNAFLLSQLEQLSQKYKESETSRGILIGDLSKAKNRYFQIKKVSKLRLFSLILPFPFLTYVRSARHCVSNCVKLFVYQQMQDLVVRISDLENALSLSNNRLLYTKEQLARENVELENAKFTLR